MAVAPQTSPLVMDAQITDLILRVGEDLTQPIASGSLTPNGSNNQITVPMRAVGLTRGFLIKVTASITNGGASAANLTQWGIANLLSNITLTDLDNYQRINTTGWHLTALNSAKEGFPFGAPVNAGALAVDADSGYGVKFGSNYPVIYADPTIDNGDSATVQMYFWVPCAYGKRDLRGALYTGVVNSTGYLAFTINPTPGYTTGDPTLAIYGGASTAITISDVTWTVYQNYVDQLPRYTSGPNLGAPILPPVSMRTQYRLVNTALSAINANQDFPIPFTNFQSFLSATAIYDNGGVLNAGSDINQWKMAAANTLQFFNLDPFTQSLRTRTRIKSDMPVGSYMFDFRDAPINTNQAGNMQLLLNASSAAANAQVLVGWESFADVQTVLGAQSLPAS